MKSYHLFSSSGRASGCMSGYCGSYNTLEAAKSQVTNENWSQVWHTEPDGGLLVVSSLKYFNGDGKVWVDIPSIGST